MSTRQQLLVSAVVAGATFLIVAFAWSVAVHGTLRWLAPLVGVVCGGLVSYVYRRAVGVRLGDGRQGEEG